MTIIDNNDDNNNVWLCADILDKMADAIGMFGG